MVSFHLFGVVLALWALPFTVSIKELKRGKDDRLILNSLRGRLTIPRNGMNNVGDLKQRLRKEYNTDVDLFHQGKRLKDDESIGERKPGEISVVVPIRGGMRIQVQTMIGEKVDLEVEPNETVLDVKKKLSKKQQLPVGQQRIIYEGKMLQDNKTLADYNIKNNSVIHMVVRLRGGEL